MSYRLIPRFYYKFCNKKWTKKKLEQTNDHRSLSEPAQNARSLKSRNKNTLTNPRRLYLQFLCVFVVVFCLDQTFGRYSCFFFFSGRLHKKKKTRLLRGKPLTSPTITLADYYDNDIYHDGIFYTKNSFINDHRHLRIHLESLSVN